MVFESSAPVAASPTLRWYADKAYAVCVPKYPFAAYPEATLGMSKPFAIRNDCRLATSLPKLPKDSWRVNA
jgi:hypothetical protein